MLGPLLLARGADIKAVDKDGRTPLHGAVCCDFGGKIEVVTLLLPHGADVKAVDSSGRTSLHVAAEYGDRGVVELLLAHGADVEAVLPGDHLGCTPLHLASMKNEVKRLQRS